MVPLTYEYKMCFTIPGNNLNVIVPSTSHPRLLHIIKPPSELDEKRIERESLHGCAPKDMEHNQSFIGTSRLLREKTFFHILHFDV